MKLPILQLALVLLGSALPQRSFGQTPWAVPTGAPNFYVGGANPGSAQLHRVLPNVLWGSYYAYLGLGSSISKLFMSTDNGQTWQYLSVASASGVGPSTVLTGELLSDVDVLDGQYAWLLAKNAANGAPILKKTVSGITGFVPLAAPPAGFTTVHFFTATTGIAVENVGAVYRTTDGGSTWAQVASIPSYATAANDKVFSKQSIANSLWLTTTNGALLRTADGGLTWTSTAGISRKVVFENVLDGLAYQMDPTPQLQRTADGGAT